MPPTLLVNGHCGSESTTDRAVSPHTYTAFLKDLEESKHTVGNFRAILTDATLASKSEADRLSVIFRLEKGQLTESYMTTRHVLTDPGFTVLSEDVGR